MKATCWKYQDDIEYLPPRAADAHKGLFGHVGVVGGNQGMMGAAKLASVAALRAGAGKVTVATHPAHASYINIDRPELMTLAIEKADQLKAVAAKFTVLAFGMGLGLDAWAESLWLAMQAINVPKIIDADGLHFLAQHPSQNAQWILTPHVGEAARLLNIEPSLINNNRQAAALAIQEKYKGVCVLKGHQTLIAASDSLYYCPYGNPGMASGGMGDALSGVIASLMAQGVPISVAARLGVGIHALAGDQAALKGQRGMLAMDIIQELRSLVNYA